MKFSIYIFLVSAAVLLGSCTLKETSHTSVAAEPSVPANTEDVVNKPAPEGPPFKTQFSKEIIAAVETRNRTIEKDPDWITWAYSGIGVKRLNDLTPEQYRDYARFLDNGTVYIIVHPAYFTFFHSKKPAIERTPENVQFNVVDLFLKEKHESPVMKLLQEQIRSEMNFVEYMSMAEKLVILVLPRNYRDHKSYAYASGEDEYARYINEITNGSPSVLYVESESPTGGKLLTDDLVLLSSFLSKTGAQNILVGGGYVGRCQKEFYNYVSTYAYAGHYFIAPEISVFSPEDISEHSAAIYLNNGIVDIQASSDYIISRTSEATNIMCLSPKYNISFLNSIFR